MVRHRHLDRNAKKGTIHWYGDIGGNATALKLYWNTCRDGGVGDGGGVQNSLVIGSCGEVRSPSRRSSRVVKVATAVNDLVFWLVDGELGCHEGSREKREKEGME